MFSFHSFSPLGISVPGGARLSRITPAPRGGGLIPCRFSCRCAEFHYSRS